MQDCGRGQGIDIDSPHWPNQPWVADLVNMSVQQPWELPLRRDLLTQAHRTVWHPHPEWGRLSVKLVGRGGGYNTECPSCINTGSVYAEVAQF